MGESRTTHGSSCSSSNTGDEGLNDALRFTGCVLPRARRPAFPHGCYRSCAPGGINIAVLEGWLWEILDQPAPFQLTPAHPARRAAPERHAVHSTVHTIPYGPASRGRILLLDEICFFDWATTPCFLLSRRTGRKNKKKKNPPTFANARVTDEGVPKH